MSLSEKWFSLPKMGSEFRIQIVPKAMNKGVSYDQHYLS
jgi:hypothetical protein